MSYFLILPIILILTGILIFLFYKRQKQDFPFPVDKVLYSDTDDQPGIVFVSTQIPLVGKPDYVVKIGKDTVPVEVKRGKTPKSPYANHIAQLFSYCYLVEEHYKTRPPYGIISYPDEYFKVEFSSGVEEHIKQTVGELLEKKEKKERALTTGRICKECRLKHKSL